MNKPHRSSLPLLLVIGSILATNQSIAQNFTISPASGYPFPSLVYPGSLAPA